MLLTMPSARLPCSRSCRDCRAATTSSTAARSLSPSAATAGAVVSLSSSNSFARQLGEVVDKIERVFDLVSDPCGQLAECCHLLGVQQARLCRL